MLMMFDRRTEVKVRCTIHRRPESYNTQNAVDSSLALNQFELKDGYNSENFTGKDTSRAERGG